MKIPISDIGILNERLFTFLLVIVVYIILGFIFGSIDKNARGLLLVSLCAPAVTILVVYSFRERTLIGLNILYACLTVGSSWVGFSIRTLLKK